MTSTVPMISWKMCAAFASGDLHGRLNPANGPSFMTSLSSLDSVSHFSSIRIIPARRVPASTAAIEFDDHCVAVDLTKSPVTLSSRGPPVGPFEEKSIISLVCLACLIPKLVVHNPHYGRASTFCFFSFSFLFKKYRQALNQNRKPTPSHLDLQEIGIKQDQEVEKPRLTKTMTWKAALSAMSRFSRCGTCTVSEVTGESETLECRGRLLSLLMYICTVVLPNKQLSHYPRTPKDGII